MKSTISPTIRYRNNHPSLPLFEVAERLSIRALPLAARRIAKRHGLAAPTALAVAELAGFRLPGADR
jgi:hypothetical protein